jgi:hypothetical protein
MEKITLQLDADISQAIKGIDKVDESIQGLNDELVTTGKGFEGIEDGSKKASKGIRGIGNALKAAGVGLAIAAFATLKEIFEQNQKVADAFNTAFEFVSIAFNDFANFVINNASVVTDFFKAIFEDPIGSLETFGNLVKENIIERFESFLDTLGFIASAVKKVFAGDFAGALDDVKNAGKEYIEIYTGVEGTFDKVAEGVTKAVKATTEYVNEVGKAAAANVELEKKARKAEVVNQGLIEQYDRQAEQLRQTRDDESKSFEERIEANEKLGKLLDEQEKTMMANADARVAQAEAELSKNKENLDLQIAYQEAVNEQAAIEAQITGFRSEQQTNANSLLREQKDLQNELALIGKSEREIERLELQQDYDAKKLLIEREVTDEAEKNERLLALDEDFKAKKKAIDDEITAEEDEARAKELADEEAVQNAKFAMATQTLGNIAKAVGENTKAGKAAAAATALINTYQGITAELATKTVTPFEFGIKLANIATTAAIGFKSVKDILKTDPKTAGGGSASTPSAPTSQPPAFNIVGAGAGNQLAETIAGQNQRPVKAFVVSQDVTTAQSLERNIVDGASI